MADDQNAAVSVRDGDDATGNVDGECIEAEPVRPYHLRLIGDRREIDLDSTIEGIVRNTSSEVWGPWHRVGLRNFRDSAGHLIKDFELRADLSPGQLQSGQEAFFRLDLRIDRIPSNVASFTLAIVEDGVNWLVDAGGESIEFAVRNAGSDELSGWMLLLDRLRQGATPTAARKLELIEDALSRAPIRAHPAAKRLSDLLDDRRRDGAYRPVRPDSTAIANAAVAEGKGDPHAFFIRHLAFVTGQPIDDGDVESYARLFDRFTRDVKNRFDLGNVPLPRVMCDWLGMRALPSSIAATPATRSMLATLGAGELIDLNPPDGGMAQLWLYAKAVTIDRNVTSSAIPDVVLRALTRPVPGAAPPTGFPALTAFMQKMNEEITLGGAGHDLASDHGRLALAIEIYLLGLENEALRYCLGPEIKTWLEGPLDDEFGLSAIELMLLFMSGRKAAQGRLPAEDVAALRSAISWLSPSRVPDAPATLRIIGPQSSPSGLGTNMRMSEQVFAELEMPVETIDVETDRVQPIPRTSTSPIAFSRPIDLFHLNLDNVPVLVSRYAQHDRRNSYRIGFALWESSAMPDQHRVGLELMDEIWAPTHYVADIYRAAGHPNVHWMGKGIELPEVRPFDLASIGIPSGLTTFLVAFDMGSWVDRKNPMAAVQAFRQAYPSDPDVRLIIKSNGLFHHPGDRTRQVARLEAAAEGDPRIILLSDLLPFQDYLGLIQAVSATLSPHRSEGFGYLPAYSLLLGVPTIVTNHSGPKDFCTEETSFPVNAALITLRPGEFVYDAPNAHWADIDVAHLAERMREVRDNPDGAIRRAHRGRDLVRKTYSMTAMAARYRARLGNLLETVV